MPAFGLVVRSPNYIVVHIGAVVGGVVIRATILWHPCVGGSAMSIGGLVACQDLGHITCGKGCYKWMLASKSKI